MLLLLFPKWPFFLQLFNVFFIIFFFFFPFSCYHLCMLEKKINTDITEKKKTPFHSLRPSSQTLSLFFYSRSVLLWFVPSPPVSGVSGDGLTPARSPPGELFRQAGKCSTSFFSPLLVRQSESPLHRRIRVWDCRSPTGWADVWTRATEITTWPPAWKPTVHQCCCGAVQHH